MAVKITLTAAGSNISNIIQISTSVDNSTWISFSGVTQSTLYSGYTFDPPVGHQYFKLTESGCGGEIYLNCI